MTGTTKARSDVASDGELGGGLPASVEGCLAALGDVAVFRELLARPWSEQLERGYGHTLREIVQQPLTWLDTAARLRQASEVVTQSLDSVLAVVVTGSGSSLYAGECVAPCLQAELGLPSSAVPAGLILTHPETCLPPTGRFLVVSVARSGDSPESRAVVDWLLENSPQARHLVLTCNRAGALATVYRERPGVRAIVLDERTNDRSLVMTSSFTNLVLAGRALASAARPELGAARAQALAQAGTAMLRTQAGPLAEAARAGFGSAVFLGSGCRLGSAREAALKMLEMNGGDVWTLAESFLGLRHGPMSAIRRDTLVVAFLSSDPLARAYELDVLRELERKGVGGRRVVLGAGLPHEVASAPGVLAVDIAAGPCTDADLTVLDAMAGQLLGFFRCLAAGFRPDSPSEHSVITRVVSGFAIHSRNGAR
jgi:tagatose-6-phosphate ketose/aldose isomerase